MRQYTYQLINKATGGIDQARATAASPDIARAQIVLSYGRSFDVLDTFMDVNAAHKIAGEIDCSNFPASDTEWLLRMASRNSV